MTCEYLIIESRLVRDRVNDNGVLVIYNGVTRATRIAKLAPGTLVPVEVIGKLRRAYGSEPSIGDTLP